MAVRKPELIIISVLLNLPIDSKLVYWRICIIFMPTSKLWGNHKPFSWHSINIKMLICEQRCWAKFTLPHVDIVDTCLCAYITSRYMVQKILNTSIDICSAGCRYPTMETKDTSRYPVQDIIDTSNYLVQHIIDTSRYLVSSAWYNI